MYICLFNQLDVHNSVINFSIISDLFACYKVNDVSVCLMCFTLQLLGNLFIFICANITGVFTKYPTEISQRRAFLETRRCIESRLTIMKENQNQVHDFY